MIADDFKILQKRLDRIEVMVEDIKKELELKREKVGEKLAGVIVKPGDIIEVRGGQAIVTTSLMHVDSQGVLPYQDKIPYWHSGLERVCSLYKSNVTKGGHPVIGFEE